MEFVRVGQQVFRVDGIIRALWRGSKLVLFFGEGVTQVEGECATRLWQQLLKRSERLDELGNVDETSTSAIEGGCV
jgi:hypothetical protein